MKLLLIKPKELTDSMAPPLGLGYIAASLPEKYDVKIIDCILQRISPKTLGSQIHSEKPDIVGFTMHTFEKPLMGEYLIQTRASAPQAVTVVGGPHPSALPEDPFNEFGSLLDFAFRGEAEKGFTQLAKVLERSGGEPEPDDLIVIPGLIYRNPENPGTIIQNPTWVAPPEAIGPPRWDLLCPERYPPCPPGAFFKKFPTAPVSISRGCPNPCTFCAVVTVFGRKIRYRRIDSVMDELNLLYKRHGIREFHIVDDNFTYSKSYVMEFCGRMKKELPDAAWTCPNGVRTDTLDDELLEVMKSSGCHAISIGAEAGDQATLDRIGKNITKEQIISAAHMIKKHGFSLRGFFIFGLPDQTKAQMEGSIRFSKELPLDMALFSLYHPFPGTRLYESLLEDGRKGRIRKEARTLAEVAYVPKGLTTAGLKSLQRKAFFSFYLRPGQILHLIRSIRGPIHLYHVAKRMFRWLVTL